MAEVQQDADGDAPQPIVRNRASGRSAKVLFENTAATGEGDDGASEPGLVIPIWSSGEATEHRGQQAMTPPEGVDATDRARVLDRLTSRQSQVSIRTAITGDVNFSWHNVSVEIPEKPQKNLPAKRILENINGDVKAGSLLAIMGASGAGKTTFLNLLTDRTASVLHVSATLAINNNAIKPSDVRKISSYVQQQDLFFGNLTVIEHLTVQALLRMNNSLSKEERLERVHEVLAELGLAKVTNSFIGSVSGGIRGLSGGEQKRLAFATEVLADPPLMFADEPTSGLDSFASQSVVQHLKGMADAGRTILCTIHQPPSEVFNIFDQLLLLAEGRTAYLGPRNEAVDYFSRIGYTCPSGFNPADFYIYTLAVVPTDKDGSKAKIKAITDQYADIEKEKGITDRPLPVPSVRVTRSVRELAHQHGENYLTQLRVIGWRTFLLTLRDAILIRVNIATTLVTSLIMGLVFLGIGGEDIVAQRVQGVAGAVFFVIALNAFTGAGNIVQTVPAERPIFLRDYENRMYSPIIYFICKYASTLPVILILQLAASSITYFMFGLNSAAERYFIFYGLMVFVSLCAESLGYIISAVSGDNVAVAFALTPVGTIPLMLFSGLLLNLDTTPPYFIWLEKISHMRWAWEAAMVNEWRNDALGVCFLNSSQPCFERGNDVLDSYALGNKISVIGENFGILAGLIVGYRLIGLALTLIILRIGVKR